MLEVTTSLAQGRVPVTVLHLRGDLDASNYQDLITLAQDANAAGAQDVLLDLSNLSYLSSSGLVALQTIAALLRGDELPDPESGWAAMRTIRRDRDTGVQPHLKLLNPQPRVDRVLETVGFKRYLEVHTDLEAAVTSF